MFFVQHPWQPRCSGTKKCSHYWSYECVWTERKRERESPMYESMQLTWRKTFSSHVKDARAALCFVFVFLLRCDRVVKSCGEGSHMLCSHLSERSVHILCISMFTSDSVLRFSGVLFSPTSLSLSPGTLPFPTYCWPLVYVKSKMCEQKKRTWFITRC